MITDLWQKPFLRIGHAGAAALAPANSLQALQIALDYGLEMVEFDVRTCRNDLVLLHDDELDLIGGRGLASQLALHDLQQIRLQNEEAIPSLAQALDLLGGRVLINLDLKTAGCEAALVETLKARHLLETVLISCLLPDSLRKIRQLAPAAITGFSYPQDRLKVSHHPRMQPLIRLALRLMRLTMPYRVIGMIQHAQANALMLHHHLVTPAVVQQVHAHGYKIFAWTVDDVAAMRALHQMGMNGIASNDPRLFKVLNREFQ